MEGNDIAPTVHRRIACWFEGLLVDEPAPIEESKGGLFRRKQVLTDEEYHKHVIKRWRAHEMPVKSVGHLVNQLGIGVDVYTYMEDFREDIEHWLARKGISVVVYSFYDIEELVDDFKYNRDVHTLFTPYQEDAFRLGPRATVVNSDGTFGF